jgi:hypothetical protein
MAETLKEAIAEEEKKEKPERRIFSIQFTQKFFFNLGSGPKSLERYSAVDPMWRKWTAEVTHAFEGYVPCVRLSSGRREAIVPVSLCFIDIRDACPRCHTFIEEKSNTGHCPNKDCTWPKAEVFHCPECKSQLAEGADYCPNKACRWGWKDPEGDTPVFPEDKRATITGTCDMCQSQLRNGKCPCGCDVMHEPKPDKLLKKGKREQWPQKEA